MKCCQQKYIYSHFYHDSMFILGIMDKSVRILCFHADKFDLKLLYLILENLKTMILKHFIPTYSSKLPDIPKKNCAAGRKLDILDTYDISTDDLWSIKCGLTSS